MRMQSRIAAAAAAITLGLSAFASPASATTLGPEPGAGPISAQADAYPCSGQVGTRDGRPIYNCPLWGGALDVYANNSDPRLGGNWIVGTVNSANTNWFWCQAPGGWYGSIYGGNVWWAETKADNLAKGWLPVYYFKGGGDNEPDGSLRHC